MNCVPSIKVARKLGEFEKNRKNHKHKLPPVISWPPKSSQTAKLFSRKSRKKKRTNKYTT